MIVEVTGYAPAITVVKTEAGGARNLRAKSGTRCSFSAEQEPQFGLLRRWRSSSGRGGGLVEDGRRWSSAREALETARDIGVAVGALGRRCRRVGRDLGGVEAELEQRAELSAGREGGEVELGVFVCGVRGRWSSMGRLGGSETEVGDEAATEARARSHGWRGGGRGLLWLGGRRSSVGRSSRRRSGGRCSGSRGGGVGVAARRGVVVGEKEGGSLAAARGGGCRGAGRSFGAEFDGVGEGNEGERSEFLAGDVELGCRRSTRFVGMRAELGWRWRGAQGDAGAGGSG